MKKTLLLFSVFGALTCFSQKKITAYSAHYFNEDGSSQGIDSTAYAYSNWQGSVDYNGPYFGTNSGAEVYLWNWRAPEVSFTSSSSYYNGTLNYTNAKVYNGSFQVTSNTSNTGYRELYTYTTSGKVATFTAENDISGTWTFSSGKEYLYDSDDRLVVVNTSNSIFGIETHTDIDSIEYIGTTMNISQVSRYRSDDGISFYKEEMQVYTYTGNVVNTLNYYGNDDSDDLTPIVRMVEGTYNYTGGNLTSLVGYLVVSDIVTTTLAVQFDYTYDGNGLLLTENQTGMFGLMGHEYVYDADGFVTTVTSKEEVNAGGSLYDYRVEHFYYQNTANLTSLDEIEFSVYPNPSMDIITVSTSNSINSMLIYSLDGKKMISQLNKNSLDISHLPQGNYILEVTTSEGSSRKMISKI